MRIEITILNNETLSEPLSGECLATWYSRNKSYESDEMDEDMKVCTVSHVIDRCHITDVQITGKYQVDNLIEFLNNLKESLTY